MIRLSYGACSMLYAGGGRGSFFIFNPQGEEYQHGYM